MNKTYHFIFGLNENFNEKPFSYFHFLNIKSCYLTQNTPTIYMHCKFEPKNNVWWEKIKEFVTIIKYDTLPGLIYNCNGKNVWRIEHQSDIFRLLILNEHGGVYADVDTLFYKPFFPHFDGKNCVMGIESLYEIGHDSISVNGLCNALIISEKQSEFINIWLDSYKNEYDDYDWNKMSVRKPYELSHKYNNLIDIQPVYTFHKYNWSDTFYVDFSNERYSLYTSHISDYGIFSKHMAESKIFDMLRRIDKNYFELTNSLYSKMCKNIIGLIE